MEKYHKILNQDKLSSSQTKLLNRLNKANKKEFVVIRKFFSSTSENKKWTATPIFSRDFV